MCLLKLKLQRKWAGLTKVADENWVEEKPEKSWYTDFLLLSYEHLFIFRKPKPEENLNELKVSMNSESSIEK